MSAQVPNDTARTMVAGDKGLLVILQHARAAAKQRQKAYPV
jgi:hypothetical protein